MDKHWRERLQLRRLADLLKKDGSVYDADEIREYIEGEYLVQDGIVRLSRKDEITLDKFLKHWRKIVGSVPRWLFRSTPPAWEGEFFSITPYLFLEGL